MFRPKVPTMPTPTGLVSPPAVVQHHPTSVPAPAESTRPMIQFTPGTAIALIGGGTTAVLVVGAVLVSMLLAVAVTGVSLAICALVIRSLIHADTKRR